MVIPTTLVLTSTGCKLSESPEVSFPARYPDPKRIAKVLEDDRQLIVGYAPSGTAQAVTQAFVKFNLATVRARHHPEQLEDALRNMKAAVKRCLEDDGQKALLRLNLWLLHQFEERLQALVAISKEPEVTEALLSGALPPTKAAPAYRRFAETGGDFLVHAARSGLIRMSSNQGIELTHAAAFFIRLAFKVRWSHLVPEVTQPLRWLLTDFEQRWYDIWVAERSRTASLERKLQAIKRLKQREPNYQLHQAHGIVFYQKQRYEQAVESFQKALQENPADKKTASFLAAAKRMAR